MGCAIANNGDAPLRFLELFKSAHFIDVSLNQSMALTPSQLVQVHLNLNQTVMNALHTQKGPIV